MIRNGLRRAPVPPTHYYFFFFSLILFIYQRVLLEAAHPHRVTYANAAFAQDLLRDGASLHLWVEEQNSFSQVNPGNQMQTDKGQRTLDSAIQEAFPTGAPVTVYPVLGSAGVTHYLIEASAKLNNQSSDEDEPGELAQQAIG